MVEGVYLDTGYMALMGVLRGLDCDTYDTINAFVFMDQEFDRLEFHSMS